MIEYLQTSDDVIACRIKGGLRGDDLFQLADRVEKAADRNIKTHMFMEIRDLDDIEWRSVGNYLPKGIGLLGKLGKFGRIAVVSDDRLVRGLTRLESALLPNISYEVYHSDERQRALDWVEGRIDQPHERAVSIIETGDPNVVAFSVDGWLTTDSIDYVLDRMGPMLDQAEGKIRVLAKVGEVHFNSVRPFLNPRYIAFKIDSMKRVDRYALVGGPDWMKTLVLGLASLFPFEVRHFDSDDEEEAWNWLRAQPAVKQPGTERIPVNAEA